MSLFFQTSKRQKLEDYSIRSSRNSRRNRKRRQRKRTNKKPAGGGGQSGKMETPITIFDDEIEDYSDKFDYRDENNNAAATVDDAELAFQQALFYSAQFHSHKNSGKQVINCCVDFGSVIKVKSKREKGGASCIYCEICEDAKPPNTLKRGSSCEHYYCEECIRNYIKEQINDDIEQVKCPVSKCKNNLNLELLMPKEFLIRVKDVIRETEIIASPRIIDCPFPDCTGELVDDKKEFLIRACPKCWRIFCVRCGDSWHKGVTCATYQQYVQRQRRLFWAKHNYYNDDDEEEGAERGNNMFLQRLLDLI